ncbi:gamma carbonic anhydrase family protein [Chelativorans sp. Marseille-P2723]|uniref:gamma carbonic anhydrase family protein n=1 Tax=Chelativorans sp. Marseille-P2723 TaxID=2709133 RepID=UPI00156DD434|nr:gamma carbonic anhydrase family protein [Chelativorans sp. Marseille-P2723]
MPIYTLNGHSPHFAAPETGWIAPDAVVIGKVTVGRNVGIWFGAVLRGDNEPITIGDDTNVQEHTMMHTDMGFPLIIGRGCTIGHRAILHGCTLGDGVLVGMGAIVLNGAEIGDECLVGAGALVTEGKKFPPRSLIIGSPAKAVRTLDERDREGMQQSAVSYVENALRFRNHLSLSD